LLPAYQNLCPKCTEWLSRDVTDDSGINDQLIKLRSTHSWKKGKERKGKAQKVTQALYFTYSWGSPP